VAKRNAMSLSVLAGRQLWAVTQAAETVCLHFGEKRVNLSPLGRAREVGELALQLQCCHEVSGPDRKPVAAWHFLTNHSPLVARVVEDGQVCIWFSGVGSSDANSAFGTRRPDSGWRPPARESSRRSRTRYASLGKATRDWSSCD
jgi:hypothetical protein